MFDDDLQKLNEIFQLVFDCSENEDVTNLSQLGSENWDSLAQVSLISAIESVFQISLRADHRDALKSYKAAILILDEVG